MLPGPENLHPSTGISLGYELIDPIRRLEKEMLLKPPPIKIKGERSSCYREKVDLQIRLERLTDLEKRYHVQSEIFIIPGRVSQLLAFDILSIDAFELPMFDLEDPRKLGQGSMNEDIGRVYKLETLIGQINVQDDDLRLRHNRLILDLCPVRQMIYEGDIIEATSVMSDKFTEDFIVLMLDKECQERIPGREKASLRPVVNGYVQDIPLPPGLNV